MDKTTFLANKVIYSNLINHYHKKTNDKKISDELTEIVKYRKWLPEISLFAMQVRIDDDLKKQKLNDTIKSLV